MEQAANLLGADLGFRSMVRQLVKTARLRGDAKTVLKSTPLVSATVAARRRPGQGGCVPVRTPGTEPVMGVLAEGDDPSLVPDVIEAASSRDPAPRAGRPSPA